MTRTREENAMNEALEEQRRLRADIELEGNPGIMQTIVDTDGRIGFEGLCQILGLDEGGQSYQDAYDLAIERFEEDPCGCRDTAAAQLHDETAVRLVAEAGLDPAESCEALDDAVNDFFDKQASVQNNNPAGEVSDDEVKRIFDVASSSANNLGVQEQVALLLGEGYSVEDLTEILSADSPAPTP